MISIGVVFFLGIAPMAGAAVYRYEGNNFDNITDEEPPSGTFDTSMKVTASVTLASELAPNLFFVDVTLDVTAFVLDDGRLTITSSGPTTTDFNFSVSTDSAGNIVEWGIFAEAQQNLGAQLVETHQIVSRTLGADLDRGIQFVDDGATRLGTDIGLNGSPGAWALEPASAPAYVIVVATRADDVFTPGAEFLLGVEVVLDDIAADDLTSVTAAFGGTVLDLVEEGVAEWEAEKDFPDFGALASEMDGTWTLTLVGGALASTSTFSFDNSALTSDDFFVTPVNLSPGNGETGVAADVVLSWDDPTGASPRMPDALVAQVESETADQEASNLLDMLDPNYIPLDATLWDPLEDLGAGPTEFSVFYADADDSLVSTINVTPPGIIAWGPPDFFPSYPPDKPFLALASETIVAFSVPEPSSTALAAAALGTLALLGRSRPRKVNARLQTRERPRHK